VEIKQNRFWELFSYRELFFFMVWRDIKIRYKQTLLGALWAIIQPFFTMIVFTLFFGKVAQIPNDGIPYPLFYYSALVPWTFFSNAVSLSGNCLINNRILVEKVYFPRIILPIAAVLAGYLDFLIALIILVGMMFYYGYSLTWLSLMWLPLSLMTIVLAGAVGMFLSALNVRYRDVQYTIPFLLQLWLFVSPIIYPVSAIPERYRILLALNPIGGLIEAYRTSLIGNGFINLSSLSISMTATMIIAIIGVYYFAKTEKVFADII
jgi:lipopolysaccharide transport system permease protein